MNNALRAVWAFRGFVLSNVKREFQTKYRNSLLGMAWMVIHPLSMILVYTVIFSHMMKSKLPGIEGGFAYSIYLCAGILTWGLFVEIVSRAQNIFIDNANLIKKLNFPKLCLPLIVVLNALLNFAIISALFLAFLLVAGLFPGWVALAALPVLVIQVLFSIGLGITLGVFNVFFRDVGQLFAVVINFWFWFTPIVYPENILPESLARWLVLNPMAPLVGAYHQIFVHGRAPDWAGLWPVTLLSVLMCVLAAQLFKRHAGEMVDEL